MNHPGSVSNSLLVMSGSVNSVCNSAPIIEEMMAAFLEVTPQASKARARVMRSANSCVSDDSDRIHEIPSAMTLDFVSMRLKW